MKSELVLFGMHLKMASRRSRRQLVTVFYGAFAGLLATSWSKGSHTGGGFLTIAVILLIGPLLGGFAGSSIFGGPGLVGPFDGRKRLKYPASASFLRPSTLLHPVVDDDPDLRNDERALRRRDYAHFVSYRFLGSLISAAFLLEFFHHSILGSALSAGTVDRIIYYLLQIACITEMTLPQAVLIWTEPDMEEDAT